MDILQVEESELSIILKLQKLAYQSEAEIYDDYSIPPLTQTIDEIKEEFKNQMFLKAVLDGKIVGSVRALEKEGTCYIFRLIVHPDYQNLGIGTRLMTDIEHYFKECQRYELFTGYKSEKNLYLYQKLGYSIFKTESLNDNVKMVYLEKSI